MAVDYSQLANDLMNNNLKIQKAKQQYRQNEQEYLQAQQLNPMILQQKQAEIDQFSAMAPLEQQAQQGSIDINNQNLKQGRFNYDQAEQQAPLKNRMLQAQTQDAEDTLSGNRSAARTAAEQKKDDDAKHDIMVLAPIYEEMREKNLVGTQAVQFLKSKQKSLTSVLRSSEAKEGLQDIDDDDVSDEAFSFILDSKNIFTQYDELQGGKDSLYQKGATFLRSNKDGASEAVTTVFDPKTGTTKLASSAIGDGYQLVNDLGETADGQTTRRVEEKQRTTLAKMTTEDKGVLANEGLSAARQIPMLARSEQLLNDYVKTGFNEGLALKVKSMTGIESGDEAELMNGLAKNTLGQLKATFGSQFTVEEVKRLETIEAGIGKSTEGNIRLIQQARMIASDAASRGMRAAEDNGDEFMAKEIYGALNNTGMLMQGKDEKEKTKVLEVGDWLQ